MLMHKHHYIYFSALTQNQVKDSNQKNITESSPYGAFNKQGFGLGSTIVPCI